MTKKYIISVFLLLAVVFSPFLPINAYADPVNLQATIGINILLNTSISKQILDELSTYGEVRDVFYRINALTIKAKAYQLPTIRSLYYVSAANPDAMRTGSPVEMFPVEDEDFAEGLSTWNLDAINVTDFGFANRQVVYAGQGVYVAVLDTGLIRTWSQYFPEDRIATDYAICFGGGGGEVGFVSSQPQKWGLDVNSHGTHVTSVILGYSFYGTPINGVAPKANVIPVKVLDQTGYGWSSVVARGIEYVGDLKAGPLADYPVVINMSLGGPALDAVEQAAIDYAIAQGVIIVASAGNAGSYGMGYPGAYGPVISTAASGWVGEWLTVNWWLSDVGETNAADDSYIYPFSSRELAGQDLDVAAPGTWVAGPYQTQMGNKISYYFHSGTSMASPHVAGTVALMAEKYPALIAGEAESIIESSAIYLPPGCRDVYTPWGWDKACWGIDATGAGLLDAAAALAATTAP